jgi:hypothetical protein
MKTYRNFFIFDREGLAGYEAGMGIASLCRGSAIPRRINGV